VASQKFNLEVSTPDKLIPNPMRKVQLMANKRLETQLKTMKEPPQPVRPCQEITHEPKAAPLPRKKPARPPVPTIDKAVKQKRNGNEDGPMQLAVKKFLEVKKTEGLSFASARSLWLVSEDRRKIIDTMPFAERKRRRFL